MNTLASHHIQTNIQFSVTKKVTNSNGFLHPHILFDKIQLVATYPIRDFYIHDIPSIVEYTFKMTKSARLNDTLTIQAQLIQHNKKALKVRILVTKPKINSKTEEVICSALFGFPLVEKPVRNVS
jgi:predicted transcriptional regulator